MRAVLQRVTEASVAVENTICGRIGPGLLVLLGIAKDDTLDDVKWLVNKIVHLRIFEDVLGKMNLSVHELDLELLVISQFTLYGNCLRGRRPEFLQAANPEQAKPLYEQFITLMQKQSKKPVQEGSFGAKMAVELLNDGPVTIILDTKER